MDPNGQNCAKLHIQALREKLTYSLISGSIQSIIAHFFHFTYECQSHQENQQNLTQETCNHSMELVIHKHLRVTSMHAYAGIFTATAAAKCGSQSSTIDTVSFATPSASSTWRIHAQSPSARWRHCTYQLDLPIFPKLKESHHRVLIASNSIFRHSNQSHMRS